MIYRISLDEKSGQLLLYAGKDNSNLMLVMILPNAESIGWVNVNDESEHFVIPLC
jgi:hypothetical protein